MKGLGNCFVLVILHLCIVLTKNETETNSTNIKDINKEKPEFVAPGVTLPGTQPPIIVKSEKTLVKQPLEPKMQKGSEMLDSKASKAESVKQETQKEVPNLLTPEADKKNANPAEVDAGINSVEYEQVLKRLDVDIESSVRTGFFILMGLSIGALLFVGFKIYKLRRTRAERKYGVQGDRSNQELAPLPISMEDSYSDEEDQTLFDINRQQIRIF